MGSIADDDPVAAPLSVLIGSGITSFALAIFAASGQVRAGVVTCGLVCVLTLASVQRNRVTAIIREVVRSIREVASGRLLSLCLGVVAVVVWMSAISPPRSADAMRYHLAHIRQIVGEGRWSPIADYHYALPFGWSFSYLPFEMLGLPQGAQVLGALLFAIFFASAASILRERGVSSTAIIGALLLTLHPAVLRAFSEASADGYALIAMLVIVGLLIRARRLTDSEAALLGFASWIGIQSRYQLVAAGIASIAVLWMATRHVSERRKTFQRFAFGSAVALVLASPFYVMNLVKFGNPVWPLLITRGQAGKNFANLMAYYYTRSMKGEFYPGQVFAALWKLVSTSGLFPLPIVIIVFVTVAFRSRRPATRIAGAFGAAFFALWFAMAPFLYPRFVLLLVPPALIGAGLVIERWIESDAMRVRRAGVTFTSLAALLAVSTAAVFSDNVRYVATGDLQDYHRYTWYYPVYQWVNRTTPADARFLVIVSSATTYYLDRPYRRADPWVSGEVDWRRIASGQQLDDLLTRNNYSYIIYEDRDWHFFKGGNEMARAVREAIASGTLIPERKFNERLYTSRLKRTYKETTVYVLRHVAGGPRLSPGRP
jgi:hypothetical protein